MDIWCNYLLNHNIAKGINPHKMNHITVDMSKHKISYLSLEVENDINLLDIDFSILYFYYR